MLLSYPPFSVAERRGDRGGPKDAPLTRFSPCQSQQRIGRCVASGNPEGPPLVLCDHSLCQLASGVCATVQYTSYSVATRALIGGDVVHVTRLEIDYTHPCHPADVPAGEQTDRAHIVELGTVLNQSTLRCSQLTQPELLLHILLANAVVTYAVFDNMGPGVEL